MHKAAEELKVKGWKKQIVAERKLELLYETNIL